MKRSTFELGEFQKCVHWQDILFVLRVCETCMGSKILSKLSFEIMKNLREPDACKKIVEARRQCKERFSMNSLFVSNFISLTLFLVIHIEIA